MSHILSVQNLSFSYEREYLFKEISFALNSYDKIGLVGENGTGKSTFLKILSQDIIHYDGDITTNNHSVIVRVEKHIPKNLYHKTVIDVLLEQIAEDLHTTEMWRIENLLTQMGFKEDTYNTEIQSLSGGEYTRILLCRALIKKPTVLLLDEPSNHMDIQSILWLEDFLQQTKISFILISHDKRLLDKVSNRTVILKGKSLFHYNLSLIHI